MSIIQAILLGLIQGLTEFLPVSSSGHLALFKIIFHIDMEGGLLFDVMLHIGTLAAIFVAFRKDVFELIKEGFGLLGDFIFNVFVFVSRIFGKKKEYRKVLKTSYRRFVLLIIIATIPTGIIGVVGGDFVEKAQQGLLIPGICLIITSVLLFFSDRMKSGDINAESATGFSAFRIGVAQGIATLPGLSRSGTTIAACLFSGYEKEFAVKFSFLMSVPAVLGAAVLEVKDFTAGSCAASEIPLYLVGMLVAAVVGYVCIKTMLVIVKKHKFTFFSIYCLVVGVIAIVGACVTGIYW